MDRRAQEPGKANLWQTAKAVLSAFVGIRRGNATAGTSLSLARIIAVAVVCAAIFVMTLVSVVKWVVG